MATASALYSDAAEIVKVDTDTVGIPGAEETALTAMVDRFNREFIEYPYTAGLTGWDFMSAEDGFDLVSSTTLNGAVSAGATSVILTSASDFDTAGTFVIYTNNMPDVCENDGKSSNTLSTVTGVDFDHADDDVVEKLYALNSDFFRTRKSKHTGDGVEVDGQWYYFHDGVPHSREFNVYEDSSGSYFLWLPQGASGSVRILYDKAATSISSSSTSVDVPTRYEEFIIWRVAEHLGIILGLDENFIQRARGRAEDVLARAMRSRSIGKRVTLARQTPGQKWRFLNGRFYQL